MVLCAPRHDCYGDTEFLSAIAQTFDHPLISQHDTSRPLQLNSPALLENNRNLQSSSITPRCMHTKSDTIRKAGTMKAENVAFG